jgi:CBS domain-containing protein
LPVCEDNGTVVGLVNVMDVIYGCGGVEGWRSIFTATLDLDDISETASHACGRSNAFEEFPSGPSKSSAKAIELNKNVMNLRPKKPQTSSVDETILAVTKKLASNRSDSAILVDSNGQLTGIITDTDITRRVVAKGLDTAHTCISVVMTPNPKFVNHNDSAMDAMMLMIEHRFRHLPVVNGTDVVGTLDIARCLNDAISKLERSVSTKSNAAEQLMKKAIESTGGANAASLEALLYPLLNKALGADSAVPSLRSITRGAYCAIVRPETSVLDVASAMAESRKAALVVDEGQLVGIFGFKDMMTRVVAAELDQASTAVSTVMTPDPEFAEPEMNAIEALKMMHDNKFLTLPIVDEDGSVVGIVDVMDVIHACGGPDHWRSIFEVALQMDDASVNESGIISVATPPVRNKVPMIKVSKNAPMVSSSPPPLGNIPSTLEFQKGSNEEFDETTFNDTYRMESASFLSDGNVVVFKIVDPDGHTHRLHSETKIVCLRKAFVDKLAGKLKVTNISFKFFDEEGDAILISTDDDLAEAVALARNASNGSKVVVKLTAEVKKGDSNGSESMLVVGIGIAVVAIAVGASMMLSSKPTSRPSRY